MQKSFPDCGFLNQLKIEVVWQNFWQRVVFCATTYLSSVIIDFFGRKVKERSCFINITWRQKHRSLEQWKIYGAILRHVLRFVSACVCVWSKKEIKFPRDATEKFMYKNWIFVLKRRSYTSCIRGKKGLESEVMWTSCHWYLNRRTTWFAHSWEMSYHSTRLFIIF